MKKLLRKSFVLPISLLILYLFGLIVGAFAISIYPINRQKTFFISRAEAIGSEYLEGTDAAFQSMIGANMYIYIYDGNGICIRHAASNRAESSTTPIVSLDKDLARALTGETLFHPAFARYGQRPYNSIMVVTGVPIHNGTAGAVFLVKNLMDLPEAILGYCCYFTLFFWLSAYFIVSNIQKNKKLDELRQTYIANVTHALKTPVASIKALSETLCDEVEPDLDKQKVYYGMILREANRQDRMIRDILELSKLQSSGMDFSKTVLRAPDVFRPVLDKYTTLCDCMDISLHVSEKLDSLPPLFSNEACIKQILEILLDNAIKFVPEGGDIWLEASCTRKQAIFCIRDNGIGITKDAQPHIFERFYKCSHDFNESGSGLGLAIATEITAGLKERIWVESESEKGATFFFTVRLK